jgi:hypothetical protein
MFFHKFVPQPIDKFGNSYNLMFASACSNHGGKHALLCTRTSFGDFRNTDSFRLQAGTTRAR